MGRTTRAGTEIEDFWPDDTDTEFYLAAGHCDWSMAEILQSAQEKWGEVKLDQISIQAEHIHTNCIWYDLHDPSDYTTFIKISLKSKD